MATPEEVAAQQPGFANLPPEQQAEVIKRIRVRMAASEVPKAPSALETTAMSAAPTAAIAAGQAANQGIGSLTASTTATGGTPGFSVGAPSYAGYAAAVMQGANAAQNFHNVPDENKATYAQQQGGLAVANVFTGGLASMAEGLGRTQWGGTMSKLDKLDQKTNPFTIGINKTGLFSSKNKDQKGRDVTRDILQDQLKLYDKDFNLTLLDGTKVNMGLDGSVKNYNIDFNDKKAVDLIPLVNPFAQIITGGDQKRSSDLVGELVNAFKNTKDPVAEMRALYERIGLSTEKATELINNLKLTDQEKSVFINDINKTGIRTPDQQQGQGATPSFSMPRFSMPSMPKPKPVDTVSPYRMGLLQDLLSKNSQPIQYPSQKRARTVNPTADNFNATMNKIIGG